jgi:protease-4
MRKQKPKWGFILAVMAFLTVLGFVFAGIVSLFAPDIKTFGGNVALIPIKGIIITDADKEFLFESVTSSTDTVELIEKAASNPSIKAIVFEINSPGGSAVASDEISAAIKKVNKTTVAWIREIGTSGAYWVASACDYVVANRMSLTGSIGVIASYLEFGGLLKEHNVTYQRLVAGKYKDIGSPFREMSAEEKVLFQKSINKIQDYFIGEVAKNRKLTAEQRVRVSDALFYIGSEAKELGLVDILGGRDEVVKLLEQKLNITINIISYKKEKSFLDVLSAAFSQQSFFVGKGIGSSILGHGSFGIMA